MDPGDHYLAADGSPAVAVTPLAATLSFTLNTDPGRAGGPNAHFGAACVTLCAGWDAQAADTSWQLIAHAVTHWTFTAPDGRVESPSGGAGELDVAFLVSVAWQGRWTVTSVQLDPALDPCGAVVTEAIGTYPNWDGSYSTAQLSAEPTGGCAVEMNHTTQPAASAPSQPPQVQKLGALLYRYGVLLAADDAAHRAKPQLPVASAHERTLAQQALALAGV